MITASLDIAAMLRKLGATPDALGEEMDKLITQEAKGFVRDVVAISPPASKGVKGKAAQKAGERRIDSDLGAVFAPVKIKGKRTIPHLFGDTSPEEVKKPPPYVVATEEAHPNVEAIYQQRAARRGSRKRLSRGQKAAWYVDQKKLEVVRKRLKSRVGILAGGYNAAAQRLGVSLPSWVVRHGTRFGSAIIRRTRSSMTVTMSNKVPYARAQKMHTLAEAALRLRSNKLQRRLPYVLRAALKKTGLKVA